MLKAIGVFIVCEETMDINSFTERIVYFGWMYNASYMKLKTGWVVSIAELLQFIAEQSFLYFCRSSFYENNLDTVLLFLLADIIFHKKEHDAFPIWGAQILLISELVDFRSNLYHMFTQLKPYFHIEEDKPSAFTLTFNFSFDIDCAITIYLSFSCIKNVFVMFGYWTGSHLPTSTRNIFKQELQDNTERLQFLNNSWREMRKTGI